MSECPFCKKPEGNPDCAFCKDKAAPPPVQSEPAPQPTPPTAMPDAGSQELKSKITLKEKGDGHTIKLKEKGAGQEIVINLNWKVGGGIFGGGKIDLDLGCFYELHDGTKSVIDGLQFSQNRGGPRNFVSRQGCFTEKPWIWHAGDDRTGDSASGEFVYVNSEGFADIRRMNIYSMIYGGAQKWDKTDASVTIKVPGSPDVVVELGKQKSKETFCVLADMKFNSTGEIYTTKCVTFHGGHEKADEAYGWGMRWTAGSKD